MRHIGSLIVSGILAGTGVLFPDFWWVSVTGIAFFGYELQKLSGIRRLFLAGWTFGAACCGMTIIWFWTAVPLDWLGITGLPKNIGLVLFCWGTVSIVLGSFFGLFGFLFAIYRSRNAIVRSVAAASLWTLTQYLQMWGFAILTIGGSSLMGAHFSAPLVGNALAGFSPLLQFARIGGIYALTFCIALLGFALLYALERITTPRKYVVLITFMIVSIALTTLDREYFFAGLWPKRVSSGAARVALVSANFPAAAPSLEVMVERGHRYATIAANWAKKNPPPDILVFPEDAHVFAGTEDALRFRQQVLGNHTAVLIDSALVIEEGRKHSYMWSYDKKGLASTYEKMLLVPQGEYIASASKFAIRLLLGREAADRTIASFDIARGDGVHVLSEGTLSVGALFCSDVLSPSLYRTLSERGANLLINAASQSPFHGSLLTDRVVLSMAKVRAVESGRFFVLAGNVIPSVILSDTGQVIAKSTKGEESVLSSSVELLSYKTVYGRLGEWVLIIPLLVCVVLLRMRERTIVTIESQVAK